MPDPSRVSIVGPLAPDADGFASELAGQGYVPRVVIHHLRHLHRSACPARGTVDVPVVNPWA